MELACAVDNFCYNEKIIKKLEQQLSLLKNNRSAERQNIEQKAQDIFRKMKDEEK